MPAVQRQQLCLQMATTLEGNAPLPHLPLLMRATHVLDIEEDVVLPNISMQDAALVDAGQCLQP